MYSKARALAYPFGNALALNAMGEVYSYTGRLREAGVAYEESLRLLDGMERGGCAYPYATGGTDRL